MQMSAPEKIATSIFNTVDQAPLAGKFLIRDTVKSYIEAPADKETKRFVGVNALLGAMVLGHSLQAVEGGSFFMSHAERFYDHSNPVDLAIAGIDGIYAVLNAVVVARQFALIPRMNQIRVRRKNRHGDMITKTLVDGNEEEVDENATFDEVANGFTKERSKAMRNAVAFTLAGQALFAGTAFVYGANDTPQFPEYSYSPSSVINHGDFTESGKVTIDLTTPPLP